MSRTSWIVTLAATMALAACGEMAELDEQGAAYAPFSTGCRGQCSPSCKCGVGEGDCDRDADCESGLVCPDVGLPGAEQCEDPDGGDAAGGGGDPGNFQVKVGNTWKGLYCSNGKLKIGDRGHRWVLIGGQGRVFKDTTANRKLFCPERVGGKTTVPTECTCSASDSEGFHWRSRPNGSSGTRIPHNREIYLGSNSRFETCLKALDQEIQGPCNPSSSHCDEDAGRHADKYSEADHEASCSKFRFVD